jgi:hypothetical protein
MIEQQELEATREVLALAKAGWASRQGNMSFPPPFGIVQRMIDNQQGYLDNPARLAVHCMGLLADYLPFEMLAVLVVSHKHLSEDTMSMLGSDFEGDDDGEFESLRSFILGKGDATEFLIEVPGDDEDWEQEMPEDLFNLLQYADRRSCSWVLLGAERLVNEELPTFPAAGPSLRSE